MNCCCNPVVRTALTLLLLTDAPMGCKPKSAEPRGPATAPVTVEMRIGREAFNLEIADSDEEQQRGLMYREFMPPDHGMIFVFEDEDERSFWMKNTLIPLDILYLDSSGRVISIKPMRPRDERGVPSDGPAMYAIELNQGAAARAGVRVGDTLQVPEDVHRQGADEE